MSPPRETPAPAPPPPGAETTGAAAGETARTRRWVWPAILIVAAGWAVALGTLAATRGNPPTLNRAQFSRADALAWVRIVGPTGGGVRAVVREAVPAGRRAGLGGTVPPGLAAGATVTIAGFPQGAAAAGTQAAAPVRRVGRGWAVAEWPGGPPRLVNSPANAGDWADLKAAAAALAAGRDPYR